MINSKNSLKLSWPESLSNITLKNMNETELWFLLETITTGEHDTEHHGIEVRDQRFGYSECFIDIVDQRYKFKYKSWVAGDDPPHTPYRGKTDNIIFYVQKYKKLRWK